ncbi:MAG: alcohol dehydrogenase catalytic domain-containing protein [Acidobacteria bacterium]|nr:alcohol dehydrogenase catalytic domain-containing protein [Acidobacteriota bacterium]
MADVPMSTRAVAYTGGGRSEVERRPVPTPGAGELLLRMRCCGLCGTDLYKLVHDTISPGTVLGHELVGDVEAVGDGVTRFAVGDRVMTPHHVACGGCSLCRSGADTQCGTFKENLLEPGGFSEHVLVRRRAVEQAARRVPDGVADEAAVFVEPAACVLRGIDKAGLGSADACAVVLGAGSMGLLHLIVLGAVLPDLGVVVTDPIEERRRLALELGAAAACAPADVGAAVAAASGGDGAAAVFDTVGGARPLAQALPMLRPGGTAVLFAHAGNGEAAGFELNEFFKAEQRLVATYSGGLDEQQRVADLIFSGRLAPARLVTHRLPLDRFAEAVELSLSRRALKILLGPVGL